MQQLHRRDGVTTEVERHLARFRDMDTTYLLAVHRDELNDEARSAYELALVERQAEEGTSLPPAGDVEASRYEGVHGWLFVLMFVLVLGPTLSVLSAYIGIADAQRQQPELAGMGVWQVYVGLKAFIVLAYAALSVRGAHALAWRRDETAVSRAQIGILAGPVASVLTVLLQAVLFTAVPTQTSLFRNIIAALIWTTYLSTSKRVDATYRRHAASSAAPSPSAPGGVAAVTEA